MGGRNHQPCNKPQTSYLRYSTAMSRSLSVAYCELERANIALEDILLSELTGGAGDIKPLLGRLNKSLEALREFQVNIEQLRTDMKKHDYTDLPILNAVNLSHLGQSLNEKGMIEMLPWENIQMAMRKDGFWAVLDLFENESQAIIDLTEMLSQCIEANVDAVEAGYLNLVVEENREGNFKVEFARLYTAWSNFQSLFLASSMLSTELWYAFTMRGSLAGDGTASEVA